eukprot:11365196-Alexandrium_andersonii.AAC.1
MHFGRVFACIVPAASCFTCGRAPRPDGCVKVRLAEIAKQEHAVLSACKRCNWGAQGSRWQQAW